VIEEAKQYNISVIAWFEFGFAAATDEISSGILEKYPNWAAKNSSNKPVIIDGIHWMNSFLPDVYNFMTSLFLEVARKYDIVGV